MNRETITAALKPFRPTNIVFSSDDSSVLCTFRDERQMMHAADVLRGHFTDVATMSPDESNESWITIALVPK